MRISFLSFFPFGEETARHWRITPDEWLWFSLHAALPFPVAMCHQNNTAACFFPHADPRACLNSSQSKLGSALEPNKSFHTCSVLRIPFKFPSIRKNKLLVDEKRDVSSCVLMQGIKENSSKWIVYGQVFVCVCIFPVLVLLTIFREPSPCQ